MRMGFQIASKLVIPNNWRNRLNGRGRPLCEEELRRIASLLHSTDMSIQQIAERMARSNTTITTINRKLQIRNYSGRRSTWEVPIKMDRDQAA
jgi:hypothetical protein